MNCYYTKFLKSIRFDFLFAPQLFFHMNFFCKKKKMSVSLRQQMFDELGIAELLSILSVRPIDVDYVLPIFNAWERRVSRVEGDIGDEMLVECGQLRQLALRYAATSLSEQGDVVARRLCLASRKHVRIACDISWPLRIAVALDVCRARSRVSFEMNKNEIEPPSSNNCGRFLSSSLVSLAIPLRDADTLLSDSDLVERDDQCRTRSIASISQDQTHTKVLDDRGELFAFGILLWELAARAHPFDGDDDGDDGGGCRPPLSDREHAQQILRMVLTRSRPPPLNAATPSAYVSLIEQCLSVDDNEITFDGVTERLEAIAADVAPHLLHRTRWRALRRGDSVGEASSSTAADSSSNARIVDSLNLQRLRSATELASSPLPPSRPSMDADAASSGRHQCASCDATFSMTRKRYECARCARSLCRVCLPVFAADQWCSTCADGERERQLGAGRSAALRVTCAAAAGDDDGLCLGFKNGRVVLLGDAVEAPSLELMQCTWASLTDSHKHSINGMAHSARSGHIWTGCDGGVLAVWLDRAETLSDVIESRRISPTPLLFKSAERAFASWTRKYCMLAAGVIRCFDDERDATRSMSATATTTAGVTVELCRMALLIDHRQQRRVIRLRPRNGGKFEFRSDDADALALWHRNVKDVLDAYALAHCRAPADSSHSSPLWLRRVATRRFDGSSIVSVSSVNGGHSVWLATTSDSMSGRLLQIKYAEQEGTDVVAALMTLRSVAVDVGGLRIGTGVCSAASGAMLCGVGSHVARIDESASRAVVSPTEHNDAAIVAMLCVGETHLWTADARGIVLVWSADHMHLLHRIPLGAGVTQMALVGANEVWLVDSRTQLHRFDAAAPFSRCANTEPLACMRSTDAYVTALVAFNRHAVFAAGWSQQLVRIGVF
jgi:hypothetical protein